MTGEWKYTIFTEINHIFIRNITGKLYYIISSELRHILFINTAGKWKYNKSIEGIPTLTHIFFKNMIGK